MQSKWGGGGGVPAWESAQFIIVHPAGRAQVSGSSFSLSRNGFHNFSGSSVPVAWGWKFVRRTFIHLYTCTYSEYHWYSSAMVANFYLLKLMNQHEFPCQNHKGHCPGETGSLYLYMVIFLYQPGKV